MRYKDETGNIYGRLKVLKYVGNNKFGNAMFKCKCICGNVRIVEGVSLRRGLTRSCGCISIGKESPKLKDLTNMRFGRLVVIERTSNSLSGATRWFCRCDCGGHTISYSNSLLSGNTKSCGCLSRENLLKAVKKHGYTKTKLYKIWCNMKRRCNDPNATNYNYYGGRGIKVCDDWNNDFIKFKDWALSHNYIDGLSLERINVNGNYSPENCKWIPFNKQTRNRRTTLYLIHNGERKPFIEWCELYNTNYKIAHQRYKKGWSFDRIFQIDNSISFK